ncbi:DNA polymerase III polC-type [Bacteroidales bacterium Barb4]|nr:DNA polymerase III polC-type [Bacteroidales bacterium Barb4]
MAQSIVDARNERPFISIEDLSNRTKISKAILALFDRLGITDDLEQDNQLSLF